MTVPLPLGQPLPHVTTPRPAHSANPSRTTAAAGSVLRVAIAGAGTVPVLAADALLSQRRLPVQVSLLQPGPPPLRLVRSAGPATARAEVIRRVLADRRLDIRYAPVDPDDVTPETLDADATIWVGTTLPTARVHRPGGALEGVVTTSEIRELPTTATSVVVLGAAATAVALIGAVAGRCSAAGPRDRREAHLVLGADALSSPETAAALAGLVELDVNVVVDPVLLRPVPRGERSRRRTHAALAVLGERFASPDAPWLHVDAGWEPFEVAGHDRLENVILSRDGELRAIDAQLLVVRDEDVPALAVHPRARGARITRAGAAPGGHVAVETGTYPRDEVIASRLAEAIVLDAVHGRTVHRLTHRETGSDNSGRVVVAMAGRGRRR